MTRSIGNGEAPGGEAPQSSRRGDGADDLRSPKPREQKETNTRDIEIGKDYRVALSPFGRPGSMWRSHRSISIASISCASSASPRVGEAGTRVAVPARVSQAEPPSHVWAVVLAGGQGVRLRSLTRHVYGVERPKQYAAL